ncbi:MAG TPA: hypothetical protein VHN77_08520 [Phycisphaerales bacterium]|nr:hypothetical protein [Phycisphaerales bacterium]
MGAVATTDDGATSRFCVCDRDFGVASFSAASGRRDWHVTNHVRDAYLVAGGPRSKFVVVCSGEKASGLSLHAPEDGRMVSYSAGPNWCWGGSDSEVVIGIPGGLYYGPLTLALTRVQLPLHRHFRIGDFEIGQRISFSHRTIAIGLAGSYVKLIDKQTGRELWHTELPPGSLTAIAHCAELGAVLAVMDTPEDKEKVGLYKFDLANGRMSPYRPDGIPDWSDCNGVFADHGRRLILFSGFVVDTVSGAAVPIDVDACFEP